MNSVRFLKNLFGGTPKKTANSPEITAPSDQGRAPRMNVPEASNLSPQAMYTAATQPHHDTSPRDVNDAAFGDGDDRRRSKLRPKRHKDRRQNPTPATTYTRPDRAAEVVYEEFNDPADPKPHGYIGTIGGKRFTHTTVEDYCPCGTGGGHYLSCGHTIVGDPACGSNCKDSTKFEQPFKCPQCLETVLEIFKTKFTQEQKEKINSLCRMKDMLAVPVAVEYVMSYLPTAKGNIAPTVMSLLQPGYGRECQDVPDKPSKSTLLADLFGEHHDTLEQNTRARLTEEKLGPLNKHQKRKASIPAVDSPAVDEEVVTPTTNKKQKAKLHTHREPITEETHGTKRVLPEEDETFIDGETLVENDSPSPTTKKPRHKLQVHREAIPLHTQGTKRKLDGREFFANTSRPYKRRLSSFPQVFGDGQFMPIPPIGQDSIWEENRKRKRDEYLQFDAGNKRQCNWEVLPGKEIEIPFVHYGPPYVDEYL